MRRPRPGKGGLMRFADLRPHEIVNLPTQVADTFVYATTGKLVRMTPEQWARLLEERKRVGRVMTRAEVLAVVRADGGHNGHA